MIRQPMAEFAGVAVFVIFGTGVDCQVVLSANKGISTEKGVRYYQAPEADCDSDGTILCRISFL
jgi:glycerol uptake facilitator-like aquaporin